MPSAGQKALEDFSISVHPQTPEPKTAEQTQAPGATPDDTVTGPSLALQTWFTPGTFMFLSNSRETERPVLHPSTAAPNRILGSAWRQHTQRCLQWHMLCTFWLHSTPRPNNPDSVSYTQLHQELVRHIPAVLDRWPTTLFHQKAQALVQLIDSQNEDPEALAMHLGTLCQTWLAQDWFNQDAALSKKLFRHNDEELCSHLKPLLALYVALQALPMTQAAQSDAILSTLLSLTARLLHDATALEQAMGSAYVYRAVPKEALPLAWEVSSPFQRTQGLIGAAQATWADPLYQLQKSDKKDHAIFLNPLEEYSLRPLCLQGSLEHLVCQYLLAYQAWMDPATQAQARIEEQIQTCLNFFGALDRLDPQLHKALVGLLDGTKITNRKTWETDALDHYLREKQSTCTLPTLRKYGLLGEDFLPYTRYFNSKEWTGRLLQDLLSVSPSHKAPPVFSDLHAFLSELFNPRRHIDDDCLVGPNLREKTLPCLYQLALDIQSKCQEQWNGYFVASMREHYQVPLPQQGPPVWPKDFYTLTLGLHLAGLLVECSKEDVVKQANNLATLRALLSAPVRDQMLQFTQGRIALAAHQAAGLLSSIVTIQLYQWATENLPFDPQSSIMRHDLVPLLNCIEDIASRLDLIQDGLAFLRRYLGLDGYAAAQVHLLPLVFTDPATLRAAQDFLAQWHGETQETLPPV
jgi:hypothetical protein